ncbi:hypothetical protein NPIL_592301 [Nephila pilipes]|uniref:Uncharacterized protein n=1 Tax=Nephila pilipes TaxID=299642 RepID=A0A8X6N9I3_NEPPI|nr:hypothetical protein NPIL_592301 [Nephila pilipes]
MSFASHCAEKLISTREVKVPLSRISPQGQTLTGLMLIRRQGNDKDSNETVSDYRPMTSLVTFGGGNAMVRGLEHESGCRQAGK